MVSLKTVSVTKALAAALAYSAGDVLSESATVGTAWVFGGIVTSKGASAKIVKAMVISETTAVVPALTLLLFKATPTSQLNDNLANTALLHADLGNYVGQIAFPAMAELGTGDSQAVAVEGVGNLPLPFTVATGDDALYGVLVDGTGFTQVATDDMTVSLTVKL